MDAVFAALFENKNNTEDRAAAQATTRRAAAVDEDGERWLCKDGDKLDGLELHCKDKVREETVEDHGPRMALFLASQTQSLFRQ